MRYYFCEWGSNTTKRITKKEAESLLSEKQIAEAIEALREDPNESVEFAVRGGRIAIEYLF